MLTGSLRGSTVPLAEDDGASDRVVLHVQAAGRDQLVRPPARPSAAWLRRTAEPRTEAQRGRDRGSVCAEGPGLLVARGGIEPPTYRFSGGRSYQLNYLAFDGVRSVCVTAGLGESTGGRPPRAGVRAGSRRAMPPGRAGIRGRVAGLCGRVSIRCCSTRLSSEPTLARCQYRPISGRLLRQLREPRRRDGGGSGGDAMTRRRSFIPRICGNGAPSAWCPRRAAMEVMGWSNSSMARRYQHMTAVIRQDAVGFLAEADLMTACLAWDASAVSASKAPSRRL
jgi:hypothetical protein